MVGVSALVCTRNRPDTIIRVVESLLSDPTLPHQLIVVDQSDDSSTREALQSIVDPRLQYLKSKTTGKGGALNEGLDASRGDIVVCTDDDCEATPGWLAGIVRVLEENPRAAIAFSNVVAPPYDATTGYVPTYERAQSRVLNHVLDLCSGHGLGAGMALRRSAILSLGGCDETMGPGGLFPSADDIDLAIRALLRGWLVCDTAEVAILHHGYRSFLDGRQHVRRDWIALGATCSKSLRAGHLQGAVPTLWRFTAFALWPPVRRVASLKKPIGLTRITAFIEGFARGIQTPVDRKRMVFTPRRRA